MKKIPKSGIKCETYLNSNGDVDRFLVVTHLDHDVVAFDRERAKELLRIEKAYKYNIQCGKEEYGAIK